MCIVYLSCNLVCLPVCTDVLYSQLSSSVHSRLKGVDLSYTEAGGKVQLLRLEKSVFY